MINVHSPVRKGSLVNQDGQFEIQGLIARGNENIAIRAAGKQRDDELNGGIEVDLSSLINFCKRILVETGALPKWFFFGVIVDASHSEIHTYFSPSKEKFFSDIYKYIKENLAGNLPMADTESVVKTFFENNRDYLFNYMIIPLESILTGSLGGQSDTTDIRF
jgi:hypothetical protein